MGQKYLLQSRQAQTMMEHLAWEQAVLWLRNQPDQQELVRACYYDDPLLEVARRYAASEEWRAAAAFLPTAAGCALDLGAGRGISSFALARKGWQVDALEPDASNIVGRGAIRQLADEGKLPIQALDGFAEDIPAGNEKYDLVFGRQVLHHAQDLNKLCGEAARVLKPKGLFIATREHVISRKEDLAVFLERHPLHHLYGGENAFLLREYLNAIRRAGLRIQRVLGSFDSPINYFPMSQAEWQQLIRVGLGRRIGPRAATIVLAEDRPWSKNMYRQIAALLSKRDQTPGRMYTFIARKP